MRSSQFSFIFYFLFSFLLLFIRRLKSSRQRRSLVPNPHHHHHHQAEDCDSLEKKKKTAGCWIPLLAFLRIAGRNCKSRVIFFVGRRTDKQTDRRTDRQTDRLANWCLVGHLSDGQLNRIDFILYFNLVQSTSWLQRPRMNSLVWAAFTHLYSV